MGQTAPGVSAHKGNSMNKQNPNARWKCDICKKRYDDYQDCIDCEKSHEEEKIS